MSGNTFGKLFQLTSFGESHGPAIGGVIDGCPSGIELDMEAIQKDLNRRKPGQSAIVTQRKEPDEVEFFSGIFDGITTGVPIGFAIFNTNQKSKDYDHIKDQYRPSHADKVYDDKYGFRDYRGGEEVRLERLPVGWWQEPSPNSSLVMSNSLPMFLLWEKSK